MESISTSNLRAVMVPNVTSSSISSPFFFFWNDFLPSFLNRGGLENKGITDMGTLTLTKSGIKKSDMYQSVCPVAKIPNKMTKCFAQCVKGLNNMKRADFQSLHLHKRSLKRDLYYQVFLFSYQKKYPAMKCNQS